ncbi:MAG: serine hydrolase [Candidatus Poribacteria bacterium]|nr:serine hydrolase [Candidatus Poribacteria bacterium]
MRNIIGPAFIFCCLVTTVSGQGLPTATPEDVGLSSTRLQRISPVMQRYVDDGKLAGVMTMVARRGKVVHFEKFGMMDIEGNKPMEFDTIFRIYSMTKPITSVAIMMLYEEGHFQLDDPVSEFIPAFKNMKVFNGTTENGIELVNAKREMTIRDLLAHTSGLTYGWGDGPVDQMYQKALKQIFERREGTLKDMVRKLSLIPLIHHPGTAWQYSVSTDVLGYLVEVISGMPLDQFFAERIFQPLKMVDTGFYVLKDKIGRFAANYRPEADNPLKAIDPPATSRFSAGQPTFFSGGGGLVSTASDYVRFCQMLLNGGELDGVRLLGRKTVELMTANHLSSYSDSFGRKGSGFGLGFQVVTDAAESGQLWSTGTYRWGGAAATAFWIDPKEELIGVLMTQLMSNPYPLRPQFHTLTYQAIVD